MWGNESRFQFKQKEHHLQNRMPMFMVSRLKGDVHQLLSNGPDLPMRGYSRNLGPRQCGSKASPHPDQLHGALSLLTLGILGIFF